MAQAFLDRHEDFVLEAFQVPGPLGRADQGQVTLWPQRLETDGFFLAKFRREARP